MTEHRDAPGLGVNRDNGDVRPERERGVGPVEVELVAKDAGLDALGQLRCIARRDRQVAYVTTASPLSKTEMTVPLS